MGALTAQLQAERERAQALGADWEGLRAEVERLRAEVAGLQVRALPGCMASFRMLQA